MQHQKEQTAPRLPDSGILQRLPLVLASGSPRRIEMMQAHGYRPEILPADVREDLPPALNLPQAVQYLALKKGLWAEQQILRRTAAPAAPLCGDGKQDKGDKGSEKSAVEASLPFIVSADTVVYQGGRITGKPVDAAEAFAVLENLRNTHHIVCTGVAILLAGRPFRTIFCEMTRVVFGDYMAADIQAYIDAGEPFDKAGGYAIQSSWSRHVNHIEGDENNVIGFPWQRFEAALAALARQAGRI